VVSVGDGWICGNGKENHEIYNIYIYIYIYIYVHIHGWV